MDSQDILLLGSDMQWQSFGLWFGQTSLGFLSSEDTNVNWLSNFRTQSRKGGGGGDRKRNPVCCRTTMEQFAVICLVQSFIDTTYLKARWNFIQAWWPCFSLFTVLFHFLSHSFRLSLSPFRLNQERGALVWCCKPVSSADAKQDARKGFRMFTSALVRVMSGCWSVTSHSYNKGLWCSNGWM